MKKHFALPVVLALASLPGFAALAPSRYSNQFHVSSNHASHAATSAASRSHLNQPSAHGAFNASHRVHLAKTRSASRKSASVSTIGFVSAPQIPAGGRPQNDQALGDANGDGMQDIVSVVYNQVSSNTVYSISVALGNGDGTFQTPVLTTVTSNDPIFVGDVDGDGKADVIQVHPGSPSSFDVWISDTNADAKFTHASQGATFSVSTSGLVGGLLTDLNGDGKLDILAVDTATPGLVWTLLGNGDGTFQTPTSVALAGAAPADVFFADFNGDGKVDFAGRNTSVNQIDVYLQGSTTFTKAGSSLATSDAVYDPCSFTAGDLTGDGKAEIVATNCNDDNITVYVKNGDGTFATGVYYASAAAPGSTNAQVYPEAATIADVNGDGKADIIVSNDDGSDVTVLLGNGDGTVTVPSVGFAVGGYPYRPALVGDFNGDGLADILVGDDEFGYAYLRGYGDGTFRSALNYYAATNSYGLEIASGDFNGDGIPDFVVSGCCNSALGISVFLSRADGSLMPGVNYGSGGNLRSLVVADFNGDGKPDIAAVDQNLGLVNVFTGVGDGTFTLGSTTFATDTSAKNPYGIVAGDFNHDGKIDLAVVNGNGPDVGILLGAGDGTFSAPTTYALSQYADGITAADLNGDGYLDLVIPLDANPSNGVAILLGKTDNTGTFNAEADVAAGSASNFIPAVGDLNGDGKADLAFTTSDSTNGQGVVVALGHGDGTFAAPILYPTTLQDTNLSFPYPAYVKMTDLDGDGNLDLIVTNAEYGTVATLFGAGDGTFSAPTEYASGGYAFGLALADVHGDGAVDAITAGDDFLGATVLLNNSGTATQPNFAITADTDTATVKAGVPATFNLTLTGKNGYTGTITFACSGLPAKATCTFAPASVVANGNLPIMTVLTIATTASHGAAPPAQGSQTSPAFWEGLSGLGIFGMFLTGASKNRRRRLGVVLGVLLLVMIFALAGCGSTTPGTPVGSHTVTVTATGTGANAPTQAMNLTVVVQ